VNLPCGQIFRTNAAASIASHPAFLTTRDPPLVWGETGRTDRSDLPDGTSEIFYG
jgi:hypothetical protein